MKTSLFTLTVKVVAVWLGVPDGCCVGRKEGFFVDIVGLNVTGALNASFLEDLPGWMEGFFAGIEGLDVGGTLNALPSEACFRSLPFGWSNIICLVTINRNVSARDAGRGMDLRVYSINSRPILHWTMS